MSFDGHTLVEGRSQSQDAQRISIAQQFALPCAIHERHVYDDAPQGIVYTHERGAAGSASAVMPPDRRTMSATVVGPDLVDSRTMHLAITATVLDTGGMKITSPDCSLVSSVVSPAAAGRTGRDADDGTGAFQLDVAQRAERLQAPAA
jgi:hypothetical protein